MIPAAVLRVLVQARGVSEANRAIGRVDAGLSEAERSAVDATREVEQFGRTSGTAEVSVDARQAEREIAAVRRDLRSLSDETVHVRVVTDNDGGGTAKKSMGETIAMAGILQRTIALVKPAALIAGLGFLAQAASAGAAGVFALGGALGPLVGIFAAGAVAASAYAQGMGVAKLATLGLSDAMTPLTDGLKKPTPALVAFGKEVSSMLLPNLRHLRNIAQSNLLPGVEQGIRSATGVFKYLDPVVASTGKALGQLAREAGALVGSGGFGRDLQAIGMRNAGILKILGRAAISVGDALRHVMVAAGPLTTWMAQLVGTWAKGAQQAAATGRESGRMAAFFESTRAVMARLFSISGSLATAFWNVAKAGKGLGNDILASLDKGAASMARWTASASGQNKIQQFFANAKGPIYEVGRLIRAVAVGFGQMSQQPGLENLIKQIRTVLLPALLRITNATTKAFGPALISMLSAFAKAFEPIIGTSGPLVLYVKVLTKLADAASWITRTVPGASQALTALVAAFAVSKAIGFAGSITGVTKAVTAMKVSFLASTGAITAETSAQTVNNLSKNVGVGTAIRYTAATVAQKAVLVATRVATLAAAAAQWVLNTAMLANPVGLVIAGIAAIIAIFVLLGGKLSWVGAAFTWLWGAIKTGVSAVLGFIRANWPLLLAILTGPIGLAVLFIVKNWNTIKSTAVSVFRAVVSVITTAWNWIKAATSNVWNAIKGFLTSVWGAIRAGVSAAVNAVRSAISAAWSAVRSVTSAVWGAVRSVVSSAINGALSVVRSVVGSIRSAVSGAWDAVRSGTRAAWNAVKDAITGAVRGAFGAVKGLLGQFVGIGGDIVSGIARGIAGSAGKVAGAVGKLVGSIPGKIKKLLGIGSPSKVTMALGAQTGEGFRLGILSELAAVNKAAAKLAAVSRIAGPAAMVNGPGGGSPVNGGWAPPPGGRGDPPAPMLSIEGLHVYVGDRELRDIARVEIERDGRRTELAFAAGTSRP